MNKIYVVGIGPGEYEQMTVKAANALRDSDVIIGYTVYVDLVKEYFSDKEFLTTPMTKEVDRCILAFDEAMKGKTVSMICSGDAGVGISEVSDSLTIIVSEETGKVSTALGGKLNRNVSMEELKSELRILQNKTTIETSKFKLWKGRLKHDQKTVK